MGEAKNEGEVQSAPENKSGDEAEEFAQQQELDPNKCAHCGTVPEKGHIVPLCTQCRDKLSRHPVPYYIKAGFVVLIIILVYAFMQFPVSLNAGAAFERGKKAEGLKDYKTAAENYSLAYKTYPKSNLIMTRLAVSTYNAGDYGASADIIDLLAGKEMDTKLVAELNIVIDGLNAIIDKIEKAENKKSAKGGVK